MIIDDIFLILDPKVDCRSSLEYKNIKIMKKIYSENSLY